jgi:tetratricopeptide (TPR) repeat protein
MSAPDPTDALQAWADDRTPEPVDADTARRRAEVIAARADLLQQQRLRTRLHTRTALAAAAVLAIAAFVFLRPTAPLPPAVPVAGAPAAEEAPTVHADEAPIEIDLSDDRVLLAAGGSLRLPPSPPHAKRVELLRGSLVAEVHHREEGESFVVAAGEVEVRVVGTRFAVDRGDGVRVSVSEGVVEVSDGRGAWTVQAGGSLHWKRGRVEFTTPSVPAVPIVPAVIPTPSSPVETAPAPVAFDTGPLRDAVLSGELAEPIALLEARLNVAPTDREAYWLLASAYQRVPDADATLATWLRAADALSGAWGGRAQFEAAGLLQTQGRFADAVEQLDAMLASPDRPTSIEGEALTRRGRCLQSLGRHEDAHADWREVIRRFPGTTAATTAARLITEPGG